MFRDVVNSLCDEVRMFRDVVNSLWDEVRMFRDVGNSLRDEVRMFWNKLPSKNVPGSVEEFPGGLPDGAASL